MEFIWNIRIRLIYTFILLVSLLQACKDAYEDQTFMAYDEYPIAMYLKESTTDYALWVEVLERSGLYNTLNLSDIYTCFVPTNAGVERYLKKMGYQSVAEIPVDDAVYLVKYHIIYGTAIDLGQFQSGAIDELNETDDNLSVEFREGGLESVYLNGEARFVQFDIKATNGIIHVIDDVLVPLTATISDRLADEKYSIFYEAVKTTGYDELLKTVYTPGTDINGNPIEIRYRYTAFAVSDETYAKAGIHSLAELKAQIGADESVPYTDAINALNKYVAYHLLEQVHSYAELGDFPDGKTTMNLNTMANNELIKISEGTGELLLNANDETGEAIHLVETNIPCKNGVIHEVDNWMPLFTPESVTLIWELSDYPDLEAHVSQFQNPSLGSQYNKTFAEGELTSIRWRAQPETKFDVLTYRNNRSADGIWYADVLHYDHLRAELGESGWIEMDSPVIVKGKYEVTFVWPSPKVSSSTGICAFAIDGVMMRPRHTISNTRTDRVLQQSLGKITFDETGTHTLRIISLDGKLITMDYLRFDPVD